MVRPPRSHASAGRTLLSPISFGVATFAALSLLACGEHSLTSPSGRQLSPTSPSRLAGASFSTIIPASPFSDYSQVPLTPTGIIVPKLASYILRIDGLVTLSPNSGNPCGTGDLQPESYGPGARTDDLRPSVWTPGNANPIWGPSETRWDSDTLSTGAETELLVSRGGYGAAVGCNAPDGSRIGGPLFTISSSQTLTAEVTRIGTFKIAVLPQLAKPVPVNTTIVFNQGNDGDTYDGTWRVDSWKWVPADGSAPVELWLNGCGISCRLTLTTSGTLTISGTVGGFLDGHRERQSASSQVVVGGAPHLLLACDAAGGAPIRGSLVLCRAQMSDGSVFAIDHRKSTANGATIVDEDIAPVTGPSYEWSGTAAVSTVVSLSGTSNGQPVNATQSFAVQSRIGADAAWQNEDFADFPAQTPATVWATGKPLNGSYPGIQALPNGYRIDEGDVGMTVVTYPNQPQGKKIPSGPNAGVRYTLALGWGNRPEEEGVAPGVYVEQSLNSSDDFYKKQVGPPPECTQSDMASLSGVVVRHEGLHWTRARAAAQPLHIVRAFEGIVELPGASASWKTQAVNTLKSYGQAVSAANDGVETEYNVQANSPSCNMRP